MPYVINRDVDRSKYLFFRFSEAEYAHRHTKIREFMAERDLDCLLITGYGAIWDRCWANIVYVMNWMGTMELPAYCVFPKEGEPVVSCLYLNASHEDRAARATIGEVRGTTGRDTDTASIAVERIQELGITKGRVGLVEPDVAVGIPANHLEFFKKELPQVEFLSVTRDWWLMRVQKSPEEVAVLVETTRWSDLAHMALAEIIRPGITERDLFVTVYKTVYGHGADHPSMLLIGSGPMDGSYANFQRNRPVNRVLHRGDIVITELGPRHPGGYEAQVGHVFTLGPCSQLYKDAFKRGVEAHDTLCDVLRVGKTESDIWETTRPFRESNLDRASYHTGNWAIVHGMFSIPRDARQRIAVDPPEENNPLLPYQFLTVEVHSALPDRTGGIFVCKPYIIMPEGPPKALSQYPLELTEL
ncbi:M24 family metallopeptidase [Chloroflexota bacterium]